MASPKPTAAHPTPPQAVAGPLEGRAKGPLAGALTAPGDKSISHRALMMGGVALGETEIHGLIEGEDVLRTAAASGARGAAASVPWPSRRTCSTSAIPAPAQGC